MFTGMMWFDNDPKTTLADKVQRAAEYYKSKYGLTANICMVNPNMMPEEAHEGRITVRPLRFVLPGHLWIGVEERHVAE
jgi:hypothetical protein